MEDKQIYTSARSEEIKRQLKSLFASAKARIKKIEEKNKARKKRIEVKTQKHTYEKKGVSQNVQVTSSGVIDIKKEGLIKKSKAKKAGSKITKETVFPILVYSIFALIILIIFVGIYLAYLKK